MTQRERHLRVPLAAAKDFISRLVLMKDEAFRLNLFETGQEMEAAIKRVGWELAERIEKRNIKP